MKSWTVEGGVKRIKMGGMGECREDESAGNSMGLRKSEAMGLLIVARVDLPDN